MDFCGIARRMIETENIIARPQPRGASFDILD
jgi:hypothetical protein